MRSVIGRRWARAGRKAPARAGVLLALAAAQLGLVVLVHRSFVLDRDGRHLDAAALAGAGTGFHRIAGAVGVLLGVISVASVVVAVGALVVVALLQRRYVLALGVTTMVIGANLTTQVLKRLVFDRPSLDLGGLGPLGGVTGGTANSLPSGHTTVAMSVAIGLVLVVPPRIRGAVAVVAAAYGGLTGIATLAARWHRPSDAVAAILVVGAWAAAACAVAVLAPDRTQPAAVAVRRVPTADRGSRLLLGGVALGLYLVAAAGLLALAPLVSTGAGGLSDAALFVAYAGGAAGVAATAAAVTATVLCTVRWTGPAPAPDRRLAQEAVDGVGAADRAGEDAAADAATVPVAR